MKYLAVLVMLIIPVLALSQTSSDSVTVSKEIIINAANRIQVLESDIESKKLINENLNKQIDALNRLNSYNETIIDYRNKEIEIYKSAVNRFVDFPTKTKEKWFETKQFNFIAGAVVGAFTIFSGAYVVSIIR